MPRKNRPVLRLKRTTTQKPEAGKIRYPSKHAAEQKIRDSKLYNPDVILSTYQSPTDGGWYLTSKGRAVED